MPLYRVYYRETQQKYVDVEANSPIQATSKVIANPNANWDDAKVLTQKTSRQFLSVEEVTND